MTVSDSPKKLVEFESTNATGGEKQPSGEPNFATPTPVVRKRRKTTKWSAEKIAIWEAVGHEIPSETDTEGETETKAQSVAVSATSGSPSKVVGRSPRLSSPKSPEPSNPAVQQPETRDFGLTNAIAARESEGTSSSVRKRLADEGQLGTSASSKRLRST